MRHFMQIVIVLIKSILAERGEGNEVKASMVCDPEARVDIMLDWSRFELSLHRQVYSPWLEIRDREYNVLPLRVREDDEVQFLEGEVRDWIRRLEEEGRDDVIKTTSREHDDCRRM